MDIAFFADKGGVGKSTLAYHVATRLRQLGHDVGLVDLDRRSASSRWVLAADKPYLPAYALDQLNGHVPEHQIRVWDTPAHPSAALRERLAQQADVAVIVAQIDPESQRAAVELWRQLASLTEVRVVFNAVQPTSQDGVRAVAEARSVGLPCCDTTVRRYQAYVAAHFDNRAVCDGPYSSADKAWSDIASLTNELIAAGEVAHA